MSFDKAIKIKKVVLETKEETWKEPKSDKNHLNRPEGVENCHNIRLVVKPKNRLTGEKILSNSNNQSCVMVKRGLGMELRKRVRKVFFKNDKKIGKRKNKRTSGIIEKKARTEMAETEKEKDGDELLSDFIEHDKKYFFVHSAKISCKLCSFKGKPIVQHYRTSHPESEVLISRINPDITKMLMEDAIRNREEYGKDYPELEKIMRSFKCPFCLMLIKDTAHAYYNHISSHTGEYCFHCNHCSYWTYNHANVHSHLNQMHHKIQKTEYKMIYLNPKVSKYVFGYICSECNFIQLVRTTVEEHAMVYHPGTPEIHKVNLGVLLHDDVDDNLSNEIQLEGVTSNRHTTTLNLSELVPPYNCRDDGFQSCPFKTLYFDEYLKHVEIIHQVDGFSSFSFEHELQREAVMEGWLAKEVGPFQCGYCRKATVTHQEMERHQAVFHAQEQCLFYYRKFVLKDAVIIPEQVNLEDPSFINHVIHLPDQIHLCDFKLRDSLVSLTFTKLTNLEAEVSLPLLQLPIKDVEVDLDQSSVSLDEPKPFSVVVNESDTPCLDIQADLNQSTDSIDDAEVVNGETYLVDESDSLCLDEQPKDDGTHIDAMVAVCKCEWKGCHQTCHSQTTLAKHINKSHVRSQKGKKLTCLWINCPRRLKPYSTKQDLLEHMRFHSAEKLYECAFQSCNKAFSQLSDLKLHQNTHTGERPYFCQFANCFKSFLTSDVRNNHQKIHYNTKRYACPVTGCSKEYAHQRCIWKHMKKHTVDEQLEAKQKSVEEKQKSSSSSDEAIHQRMHYDTLQCEWKDCHQTYDSQVALVNHIKKNHVQLQTGEKFTCSWVNCPLKSKPFSTKSRLSMHMRVHTGEKPHKCSFHGCNRAFAQLGTLQVHERRHTGKRPYLCQFPNCLKRFATNYIRSRHQRTHCNTVLYGYFMSTSNQVTSCSEKYTDPDSLEKHVKNHMVNKQFKAKLVKDNQKGSDFVLEKSSNCSDGAKHQRMDYDNCKWKDCYQTCHSKSALVRHIENDHVLLQKGRIFICFWINCPRKLKPYTTKQNLVVHMRTHSKKPYKCAFQGCSMKSSSLSSLKIHQRNHTKKKTYLCEYPNCFKSFSQSSNMIDHQMTHYDTEAYACQVISCSKKYADPNSQLNRVKQKSVENEQKENDFIIYDL